MKTTFGICKKCCFLKKGEVNASLSRTYSCFRYPPKVHLIVTSQGVQITSLYPQIESPDECGCGDWGEEKPED